MELCDKHMCTTCDDQIRVTSVCISLNTPNLMLGGKLQEVGQGVIKTQWSLFRARISGSLTYFLEFPSQHQVGSV